jgi:hypothetical protein
MARYSGSTSFTIYANVFKYIDGIYTNGGYIDVGVDLNGVVWVKNRLNTKGYLKHGLTSDVIEVSINAGKIISLNKYGGLWYSSWN